MRLSSKQRPVNLTSQTSHTAAQDDVYRRLELYRSIEPPEHFERGKPASFTPQTRKTYAFTTENITAYIGDLDLEGKSVASVAGSTDFPINAYLYGAARVDVLDISPVACLFGELKIAGLMLLSYEEFLAFFGTAGCQAFGPQSYSFGTYARLRPSLSQTAQTFFDVLITADGRHPFLEPGAMLIALGHTMCKLREMSPYLQGRFRYRDAQRRARPTLFFPQAVNQFLAMPPARYDVIYLSNILAYGDIDAEALVHQAAAALPGGGHVVVVNFIRRNEVSAEGCPDYLVDASYYGLPAKVRVAPDGQGSGSIRAYVFEVQPAGV